MDVVINASPVIFLSKINRIWILNSLFDNVFVPKTVLDEVNTPNPQPKGMWSDSGDTPEYPVEKIYAKRIGETSSF